MSGFYIFSVFFSIPTSEDLPKCDPNSARDCQLSFVET